MNKEAGSLIKYYKTGLEEDGYKGYSTNYQDLNVDYKVVRMVRIMCIKISRENCKMASLLYYIVTNPPGVSIRHFPRRPCPNIFHIN
jgi:hypothetical protein